jgi:hypothetical protein
MVKALSIRQPWAWLIVSGYKDVENRTWATTHRGLFLIHASGRPMTRSEEADLRLWCEEVGIDPPAFPLPTGGIVGRAVLDDCVTSDPEDSPWFEGPYGFLLGDTEPLPFFPCKGRLGFFDVDYPEF